MAKKDPSQPAFNPHTYKNELRGGLSYATDALKILGYSELYLQLSAPFPDSVVERSEGAKTGKGYNTTGIKYQAVVDRFNDVLTPWGWSYRTTEIRLHEIPASSGRTRYETEADIEITVLGSTKGHTGAHTSNNRGDARKGAITNAFKKCAAMFGVGRQAYIGTLDDDNAPPAAEDRSRKTVTEKTADVVTKVEEKKPTFTPEDLAGNCWIGKNTKNKPWGEIPISTLKLIENHKSDPKASAIASQVIAHRKFNDVMNALWIVGPPELQKKVEDNLKRLQENMAISDIRMASPAQYTQILTQLTTIAKDGLTV